MDRAWQIEQEFWQQSASADGPQGWFARYLATDGFVVLPNRIVSRSDLVHGWKDRGPIGSWSVSEPAFTVFEGGNLVITYEVHVDGGWLPKYDAFITSVYVWGADEWTLICRTHTPRGAFPF
jgi:hypothetical protein